MPSVPGLNVGVKLPRKGLTPMVRSGRLLRSLTMPCNGRRNHLIPFFKDHLVKAIDVKEIDRYRQHEVSETRSAKPRSTQAARR